MVEGSVSVKTIKLWLKTRIELSVQLVPLVSCRSDSPKAPLVNTDPNSLKKSLV